MSRRPLLVASAAVCASAALALVACGSSTNDRGPDGPGSDTTGTAPPGTFSNGSTPPAGTPPDALDECRKMDIIFTVDNSGSMAEEQKNLAANFPKFVDVIDKYRTKSGEPLDYRIAVTTSDDDDDKGQFTVGRGNDAPKNCASGPKRPWLERPDGDVAGFFSCRAQAGTKGTNRERPLESTLLGVTARVTDGRNNDGATTFVRDDALLAFVVITDEDEGGTEDEPKRDVDEYPALFDAVKKERGRWAAAVIAGERLCMSPQFGTAAEAKRLKSFVSQTGKNGVFASICTGDLTEGLTKALGTFDAACKSFPSSTIK